MNFVSTKDRNNVALSYIASYAHMESGNVRIVDRGGDFHTVDTATFEQALASAFQAVIPAQPGTFFLTPVDGDGATTWDQDQVVAWGITYEAYTIAIGTNGPDDMNRAILMPNGTVTSALGDWSSLDDYLKSKG